LRGILNIGQTTEWEEQLNLEPEEFEKNIIRFIREGIKKGAHEIYQEETLGICPRCGKGIVEGKKWYYCNSWNSEKKCDFKIWKTVAGGIITAEDVRLLLNQKQTGIKKCESKGGKKFEAAFRLDGENNITFIFKKRAGKFKGKKTKAK
jgi:DNA topoisomerase-3